MNFLEERLIDYATGPELRALPPAVVHQAKRRMVDTLGAALAAYPEPVAYIARKIAVPTGGPLVARVWGSLQRTSPELAGFANGVLLRYLDLNDSYGSPGGAHPSDCIGAILAVAEARHASGREFLAALVMAYEIQCRFADSLSLRATGWDQGVLVGQIATALAAARLLSLSRQQMRNALALSIIPGLPTFQSRTGELAMWKGCAAANGGRQAIFAALLAAEGMEGPDEPFDGKFGLWRMTGVASPQIVEFATPSNDRRFAITESLIKSHPVRYSIQLPVDTALKLRSGLPSLEIEALTIETARAVNDSFSNPELWAPKTRETADHSMPATVAMALIDGEISPDSFRRERFKDADVLALLRRTKIEISDEFTRTSPKTSADALRQCRITAVMKGGGVHKAHLALSDAELMDAPDDAGLEAKFARLTRDLVAAEKRRALLDAVWRLEEIDDCAALVDGLSVDQN